jgi:tetratricopeptide (TPR) repeat protein
MIADILQARGDLDEAMRIRTEQELPVYRRLGDVRAVAITLGRIADILKARGDPDTALAMHEARLATNRQLQDASGIAASLWAIANIELDREQVKQAVPRVIEAWTILDGLDEADGIATVGPVMGQILAAAGQREEALAVLARCAGARRKLGRIAGAEAVEGMMRELEASSGAA